MEMSIKDQFGRRRNFVAVAIFFGVSASTCFAAAEEANSITSNFHFATGVNIFDTGKFVTQRENIFLTGSDAVGIRVGGVENYLRIPSGTTIQTSGANSKGVLILYGRDNRLHVVGEIFSAGTAVEFNAASDALEIAADDPSVNYFDVSGTISGDKRAVYIGKNSFVRNVNVHAGAKIYGDIVSDWGHLNTDKITLADKKVAIRYDGQLYDATRYIPDLVTHLNFNGDVKYDGDIVGADNIKIHVRSGTLNYSGTADVVSVNVREGAKLFGGSFWLNDMTSRIAADFTDSTTGKFINHGTIGAGSPNTNLIINGDLISDGVLQKVSGGSAGMIIVHGSANVDGSTVTTDSLLPNETATVLIADSISGKIANPAGKPVPISAMLSATGKIVGNKITVTTHAANNYDYLNSSQAKTFDAMQNMFDTLDTAQRDEMRTLYNLEPAAVKQTLTQISSNDAAQIMSVAQQSTAVDKMISNRIMTVFAPEYVDVSVGPMNFADDDSDSVKVNVKVPTRHENNFWLNYSKNWGSLRGGTDYHGSVIVGGYDKSFGSKWRAGFFATYGTIGYGADSSRATVYDTRLGLYAGSHSRYGDVYLYVNGGQLRNSLHRGIPRLGLSTNANYKSRIVELGGEYKYDLQPRRIWHVSPYVNVQASYLHQSGYEERGAGIYNQHVDAANNTYFAAQVGLDLKRYSRTGMFGMRFGVKHGFTGADPDLRISYEGDGSRSYHLRERRDKTHFVFGLRGENEFARGWFAGGEAELQLGENDRDVTASLMLRRTW